MMALHIIKINNSRVLDRSKSPEIKKRENFTMRKLLIYRIYLSYYAETSDWQQAESHIIPLTGNR